MTTTVDGTLGVDRTNADADTSFSAHLARVV